MEKEKLKPNFAIYLGLYSIIISWALSLILVVILPFYGIVDIKIFLYILSIGATLAIPGFYCMIKFAIRGNHDE